MRLFVGPVSWVLVYFQWFQGIPTGRGQVFFFMRGVRRIVSVAVQVESEHAYRCVSRGYFVTRVRNNDYSDYVGTFGPVSLIGGGRYLPVGRVSGLIVMFQRKFVVSGSRVQGHPSSAWVTIGVSVLGVGSSRLFLEAGNLLGFTFPKFRNIS